ncbi:MAG: chromate resistance protein [Stagnimonas sp.]|nr:chromate resistance protein [Stagnimonas sp.]
MDTDLPCIAVETLLPTLWRQGSPLLIDVRRQGDFELAPRLIAGALRRGPELAPGDFVGSTIRVVTYCAHGRAVSQSACRVLREAGIDAAYLEGGYSAWQAAGLPTTRHVAPLGSAASRWITRERPKIDRVACPWLIRRFIDPKAEFFYVPTATVKEEARRLDAVPYDIPAVDFSHFDERCSFDAFLRHFDLRAPGLERLATIVRGADTARLALAPEAAGLLAISLGLSANFADDHAMLEQGMVIYDALYAWCRSDAAEGHDWKPQAMAVRA